MPLSDTTCRNAKPKAKPYKLKDGIGLYLLVNPNGSKWWRLRFAFDGKEQMLSLGTYPEVSLKEVRERQDVAWRQLANGINPSLHRKTIKLAQSEAAINSFEAIAREWLAKNMPTWAVSHSSKIVRRMEKDVFPYLGARPVSEIKPAELLACLRKIEARDANETAHRALTECGQVFRYAVASGHAESDPTRDLRGALAPKDRKHFSAITDADGAAALMRSIIAYSGTPEVCAALRLSALLFQRPGEIRAMEWTAVDLGRAEWRYIVTKTKSPHLVPLSTQALAVLRALQPLTGHGCYVFPSARSGQRSMSENAVRVALRAMGYSNEQMTPHGFRAMARSLLAELGWKADAIERQLAHKAAGPLGAAYDRALFLGERKAMMQAWADYLDSLVAGQNKSG